jgi:hypothetical protein
LSTYDDILYAHPALRSVWYLIQSGLKTYGLEGKLGSVHRLPEEQFALFRKGRVYVKGEWVVDSDPATSTVTTKDGYVKPSHHNMLPTGAVDINLFRGGAYLKKFEDYTALGQIVQPLGLEWGGNWKSLKDGPHIQIFDNQCLGGSAKRECGEQWQRYLVEKAGKDIGVIDGYPGAKTLAALKEVTGHDTLCPAAWKALYDKFGPLIP